MEHIRGQCSDLIADMKSLRFARLGPEFEGARTVQRLRRPFKRATAKTPTELTTSFNSVKQPSGKAAPLPVKPASQMFVRASACVADQTALAALSLPSVPTAYTAKTLIRFGWISA